MSIVSNKVVYVYETGFRYEVEKGRAIFIHRKQYYDAREILNREGCLTHEPKDERDSEIFLLDGHYVELTGINHVQGSNTPRLIKILTEPSHRDDECRELTEKLNLPLL